MSNLASFLFALLILGMIPHSMFGQTRVAYTQESLAEIRQKVERNEAILLDVREVSEWQQGHLEHAILIPTSSLRDNDERLQALKRLDKSKPIYCHCKAGGRALVCGQLLKDMGYDVRPLKQSYQTIVKSGFDEVNER